MFFVVLTFILAMPIITAELTCAEFANDDKSIWYKDEVYDVDIDDIQSDFCDDYGILWELTCNSSNPNMFLERWRCSRGCSGGRCVWTMFFLAYQLDQSDITGPGFWGAVDVWIDN